MRRSTNLPFVKPAKLEHIRSGNVKKTQVGETKAKTRTITGKSGKFAITQKAKKFEESGVTKKKKNFVEYVSKIGTEKQEDLTQLRAAEPKPRKDEKIIQTRKKREYLDNYQYHETKEIKNTDPRRISKVRHRRLGEAVGGTYEEKTFTKSSITSTGKGPKVYSSQTTKISTRTNASGNPTSTTKKTTITSSSNKRSTTVPAKSQEYRKEVKKYSTNTNLRSIPKKPESTGNSKNLTSTNTKTFIKSSTKTTRAQSASSGRRH